MLTERNVINVLTKWHEVRWRHFLRVRRQSSGLKAVSLSRLDADKWSNCVFKSHDNANNLMANRANCELDSTVLNSDCEIPLYRFTGEWIQLSTRENNFPKQKKEKSEALSQRVLNDIRVQNSPEHGLSTEDATELFAAEYLQ